MKLSQQCDCSRTKDRRCHVSCRKILSQVSLDRLDSCTD